MYGPAHSTDRKDSGEAFPLLPASGTGCRRVAYPSLASPASTAGRSIERWYLSNFLCVCALVTPGQVGRVGAGEAQGSAAPPVVGCLRASRGCREPQAEPGGVGCGSWSLAVSAGTCASRQGRWDTGGGYLTAWPNQRTDCTSSRSKTYRDPGGGPAEQSQPLPGCEGPPEPT